MDKSTSFFNEILKNHKKSNVKLILVTHLLIDRPEFIESLSKIVTVVLIIPKPKTINESVLKKLKEYTVLNITREKLGQKGCSVRLLKKYVGESKFIISDIGGYFAYSLHDIKNHFGENFLGVIEDTENGFKKYLENKIIPCPIYSVARSPLKSPEDTLVADSTIYSAERVLREKNEVLRGRKALVIGFGKIGFSIAKNLSKKQVATKVWDTNSIKLVQALSEGFDICNRQNYLKNIDLIFSITGNKCLNDKELNKIKGKVYIFSITSSDDEFDFKKLSLFKKKYLSGDVILTNKKTEIHLINKGNAVNFLHGAVVGNFIRLVQAEILLAAIEIIQEKKRTGVLELPEKKREFISNVWIKYFN